MQVFLVWKTEESCRCEECFCEEEIGQADTLTLSPNTVFDENAENQLKIFEATTEREHQKKEKQFLKEFGLGASICLCVCMHVCTCVCTYMCTRVCMCTENISDQSLKTACSKNKEHCILSKTYFKQQEIETQEYYRKVWKSSHSL